MNFHWILIPFSLLLLSSIKTEACKGCVNLDEYSFTKLRPHFDAILVKFDVAYPYGDKHETYTKFASELIRNDQILVTEIGVKDYGERDNEELAQRYGVTKNDFPAVKLFKRGVAEPISYSKSDTFTVESLRTFVRDNTDIYLGLPGCLEAFDQIARKFIKAENRNGVLNEAESLLNTVKSEDQNSAKIYTVIMKRIIEHGPEFQTKETKRIKKLLTTKLSVKKQTELENRLNILRAFQIASHQHNNEL